MKHNYKRSAYADNAHGGRRKRAMLRAFRQAARSADVLLRSFGKGLVRATRVWTDPAGKEA